MKNILPMLCLTGVLVLLAGCSDTQSRLLTKHMSNQRREQAQEHWDTVRGEVKVQLARQHLDAGRLDEAEKVLDQAAAVTPNEPQVYVLFARLRLEQGRLAEARQLITKAASTPSEDPEIPYLAGIIAQRYGEQELAADCYQAAIKKAPNNPGYVLALGETLFSLGRTIDALELIEDRLRDFDSNGPLRALAARVCRSVGLRNPAVQHAREALRITPDDAILAADCAQILVWAEHYGEAVNLLEPLVDQVDKPGSLRNPAIPPEPSPKPKLSVVTPSLRRCLATAYLALHKPQEAMGVLEPILGTPEEDGATLLLQARAAAAAGDWTAAAQALERSQRLASPTVDSLMLDAAIALQRGDFVRAFEKADAAAALDPSLSLAKCIKGRSAEGLGRRQDARTCYIEAIAIDSHSPARSLLSSLENGSACETSTGLMSLDQSGQGMTNSAVFRP